MKIFSAFLFQLEGYCFWRLFPPFLRQFKSLKITYERWKDLAYVKRFKEKNRYIWSVLRISQEASIPTKSHLGLRSEYKLRWHFGLSSSWMLSLLTVWSVLSLSNGQPTSMFFMGWWGKPFFFYVWQLTLRNPCPHPQDCSRMEGCLDLEQQDTAYLDDQREAECSLQRHAGELSHGMREAFTLHMRLFTVWSYGLCTHLLYVTFLNHDIPVCFLCPT